MSHKGDPYDNAVAKNFFSCLKCELVHHKRYATKAVAQTDIFAYVEAFYNAIRPHSALAWLSPKTFEQRFSFVVTIRRLNSCKCLRFFPFLLAFSCLFYREGLR